MGEKIEDKKILEDILSNAKYLRLALCNENKPYIVPMSFGYENDVIYLHSSPKGTKIDILKNNSNVCFETDNYCKLLESDKPCSYSMRYQSVVGFGKATILESEEDMREGFRVIIDQYHNKERNLDELNLKNVAVIHIAIKELYGTQHAMPVHEQK